MRTIVLGSPAPHYGTAVTRVWVGPGGRRVAVVFADVRGVAGSAVCRDTHRDRGLWRAVLRNVYNRCCEPAFTPDLTVAGYAVIPARPHPWQARMMAGKVGGGKRVALSLGTDEWVGIDRIAVTPDGEAVLAAVHLNGPLRRKLVRWPRAGGADPEPIGRLRPTFDDPTALACSPDGRRVAVGGGDGSVGVWNLRPWRRVLAAPCPDRDVYRFPRVPQLAWAPDGSWLAAVVHRLTKAHADQTVGGLTVWAVPGGKTVFEERNAEQVHGIAVTPDGRTLWVAGPGAAVVAWDTATWAERGRYDFGIGAVTAVAVAPDGTVGAAGGEDGRVVLWDLDA
jgi:WD40 repeat protein